MVARRRFWDTRVTHKHPALAACVPAAAGSEICSSWLRNPCSSSRSHCCCLNCIFHRDGNHMQLVHVRLQASMCGVMLPWQCA